VSTTKKVILAVLAVFVSVCGLGAVIAAIGTAVTPTAAPSVAGSPSRQHGPDGPTAPARGVIADPKVGMGDVTASAPPAAAPAPTTAAVVPPAPVGVADGTWTVGEDLPAGTYKATGAGDTCYWAITRSGSNGSDIVDNAIGGGNLRVTVKAGQDFETKRCGTWVKVA
jgi:hypothetical protein